jgi:hypothetical protein
MKLKRALPVVFSAVLWLVVTGTSQTPAGNPRIRFLHGGSAAVLPLILASNAALIPAQVDDAPPRSFVLDTGSARTVIDASTARVATSSAGIPLLLPGLQAEALHLEQQDLEWLSRALGHRLGGVVGNDLLQATVVWLDYDRSSARLYPPQPHPPAPAGYHRLALQWISGRPAVRVRLHLPGRTLETPLIVATGSADSVVIARSLLNSARAAELHPALPSQAIGPMGRTAGTLLRGEWIELAGFRIPAPPVLIADALPEGLPGWIGGTLLSKFRMVLDEPAGRLWLEPNPQFIFPIELDASGLDIEAAGPHVDHFVITRVLENSPAAAAGLQPGDRIVSLDGEPAERLSLDQIRDALRRAGRSCRLVIERQGRRLEVELSLRRLL